MSMYTHLVGDLQALINLPDGLVRGSLLNHLAGQLQVVIGQDDDRLLHILQGSTVSPDSVWHYPRDYGSVLELAVGTLLKHMGRRLSSCASTIASGPCSMHSIDGLSRSGFRTIMSLPSRSSADVSHGPH